ncbi:NAD-binding protein [Irpex rosettiformis]|uniref:NAD-binding protein n=1 Tax=Irpex rosettiformis TaxID=378272 RepID=A0ACB8UCH0_9APHY|nr:NAD-binding protein [Irpex rosettiformis]
MITKLHSSRPLSLRAFSTSPISLANRAIIFPKAGNPADVLQAQTYPSLPPPTPHSINVRYRFSPINPADINVIEGKYPAKPTQVNDLAGFKFDNGGVFVGGNEGLAVVTEVGESVEGLKKGDRVVMSKPQSGTWRSASALDVKDVMKVPDEASDGFAATMTVNLATAYNMLNDFVDLKEGDWVIQNGANSAVGQAVIQIAAHRGLKTLNFVRNRKNFDELKSQLTNLGATQVITYDELAPDSFKDLRSKVQQWTGGNPIRLFLNCVSGPTTTSLLRLLGKDAHLVSYGAMSKEPLSMPTSLFIFKNLTCHGFWQSRWYEDATEEEKRELVEKLVGLKLKEAEHEVLTIPAGDSDGVATEKVRDVVRKLAKGQYGKKVLLNIEQPVD